MSSTIYINTTYRSQKKLLATNDLRLLLKIKSPRTLEDLIKRLINEKILTQLEKGKYRVSTAQVPSFEISQFLYSPSYVSFETALNYHGILSQFPIEMTSVTTKKRNSKTVEDVVYSYSRIPRRDGLFTNKTRKN